MDRFTFARAWLDHYTGQCVGKQGIDVLVKGLSQAILSRGYVTTRVLVPEQDLTGGTLKLSLIPGVIRHVRFADEALRGTWKTAFPTGDGELLNLRDLEQGLEQMKRVTQPGRFDADRSGRSAGRKRCRARREARQAMDRRRVGRQLGHACHGQAARQSVGLGIDNPLGLNDLFNIGVSQDLEFGDKRLGSHGWNGFVFDPVGLLDRNAVRRTRIPTTSRSRA